MGGKGAPRRGGAPPHSLKLLAAAVLVCCCVTWLDGLSMPAFPRATPGWAGGAAAPQAVRAAAGVVGGRGSNSRAVFSAGQASDGSFSGRRAVSRKGGAALRGLPASGDAKVRLQRAPAGGWKLACAWCSPRTCSIPCYLNALWPFPSC